MFNFNGRRVKFFIAFRDGQPHQFTGGIKFKVQELRWSSDSKLNIVDALLAIAYADGSLVVFGVIMALFVAFQSFFLYL